MEAPAIGYVSTRSPPSGAVSFEQALLAGLAPDGGLYLPTEVPPLPDGWRDARSLAELAALALPRLLGMSTAELEEVFADALDFPVPLVRLPRDRHVLELFHGPTAAFKDFGARSLARLMERSLARRGRHALILVATSGDTGGAVADAFAGLQHCKVALLYPAGRVSPVQERQLTLRRPGVIAYAVAGTFDDCQRLVKEAFRDPSLAGLGLSSANSINVARLLPQTLYHLWGAARVAEAEGREAGAELTVVVPSGNLGNLTSGLLASRMAGGIGTLVAAHNSNDYYPRYLHGEAQAYAFQPSLATLSNAMDVGAPSNFERLVALLSSEQAGAQERVLGVSVSDEETRAQLRATFAEDGYLACPHTSVGLRAIEQLRSAGEVEGPALLLATAHPGKFPEVVTEALGPDVAGLALPNQPADDGAGVPLEPRLEALRDALLTSLAP